MNLMKSVAASGVILLGASALAACGGDAAGVEVSGTWSRTSPAMSSAGVVYFDLTSSEGDVLLGAKVDPSIAAMAELHETVVAEMAGEETEGMDHDDMDHDDMDHENMDHEDGMAQGSMSMVPVDSVTVPKGETVSFMPGGLHLMLIDLVEPLEEGQEFDVTLTFATAGDQITKVKVLDSAP